MTTKEKESEVTSLFDDAELIHKYTRAEALADGVLVDASELARELNFRHPVALTCSVWAHYVRIPEGVSGQDEIGRLWDILWMTWLASKRSHGEPEVRVQLLVRNSDEEEPQLVTLKALCDAGDSGEPVITIMLLDED